MNTTDRCARAQKEERENADERYVGRVACPACGGPLIEIRAKLQCSRCHTICEGCCEGGPA